MKKYEIPFNFDLELLNFLDEKIDKNWIEFLFLSPFKEDSTNARSHVENVKRQYDTYTVPKTREEYTKCIYEIEKRGYRPAVLFQEDKLMSKEKLDYYFKLGIKDFIVNSDKLAIYIKDKNPDYNVVASITKILSAKDIWEKDYSMYDKIVLYFPFNRAIDRLKELPTKYKYIILANSYCAYNCVEAKKHWSSTTKEALTINCVRKNNKDKLIYIPPEYTHIFEPYVANFKLQGREYPTYMLANEIYYYYNKLHNPQAGVIYNRLSPFNQQEYFNAARDLKFVVYGGFTPQSPTTPNSPNTPGGFKWSA
ncbi:hypothetical protein ACFIJ5_15920 [Haloimpatiens sp. FM7330]|uniref:hypothetical protein n=1 Tax=Haloimpatiens sp. FM7330 TaxID=3298610 RepID=UPI003637C17F